MPHCSRASQHWHPSHCWEWGSPSCNVTSSAEPRGAECWECHGCGAPEAPGTTTALHLLLPLSLQHSSSCRCQLGFSCWQKMCSGTPGCTASNWLLKLSLVVLLSSSSRHIFGCRVPLVTLKKLLRTPMIPKFSPPNFTLSMSSAASQVSYLSSFQAALFVSRRVGYSGFLIKKS